MSIEIFPIGAKPSGKHIESYLRRRLTGDNKGIAVHRNTDRSWSITSLEKREYTFDGSTSGQLEVSPEGAQLLRLNPHLLHRVRSADVGELVGEGNEANIHKQRYVTDHGPRWHAVKYTFPVRPNQLPASAPDYTRFTPGTAHYHVGKFVAEHAPRPINLIPPVLATHDVCISPLVHHGIPLFILDEMTAGTINPRTPAIRLSENVRSFVEHMKTQDSYTWFIHLFNSYSALNHAGMAQWLEQQIRESPDAGAIRSALQGLSFHTKEIETPRNTLVHVPTLRKVLHTWLPYSDRLALLPEQTATIGAYQKKLLLPNSAPYPTPDATPLHRIRESLTALQQVFLNMVAHASYTVEAILGYKININST